MKIDNRKPKQIDEEGFIKVTHTSKQKQKFVQEKAEMIVENAFQALEIVQEIEGEDMMINGNKKEGGEPSFQNG